MKPYYISMTFTLDSLYGWVYTKRVIRNSKTGQMDVVISTIQEMPL